MKKLLLLSLFLSHYVFIQAQDFVHSTFTDTRVVNGNSVEMNGEGMSKFLISHRFGRVNSGIENLFGLDESTIRFGFDYGLADWLDLGFGRSSFEKTYDGFFKLSLRKQTLKKRKLNWTTTLFASMAINTLPWENPERQNFSSSRMFYTFQLLLAKKFSDNFSLQFMPTLVHRNIVKTINETNDVISIGIAPRFKLSQSFSITSEFYYTYKNQLASIYQNSLAVGLNFETNGHAFQITLGNSRGMIEKFFITQTTGDWTKGAVHLGFNIVRDFRIKGRQY